MSKGNKAVYIIGEWVSHWKTNEVLGKIVSVTEDFVFVDTFDSKSESFFFTEIRRSTTDEVLIARMKKLANPLPEKINGRVYIKITDLNQLIELAQQPKAPIELDLFELKLGCTLQKGQRKRVFLGVEGFMVYYQTASSKSTTGERIDLFKKWMKGARLV